jgi:hypothetical protein
VVPTDNLKLVNFLNFSDIGQSLLDESTAFKAIKMNSKVFNSNLVFLPTNYSLKLNNLYNTYENDSVFLNSYLYGIKRQHSFLNNSALLNNTSTFYNLKSVDKFLQFNYKNKNTMFSEYNGFNLFNFSSKPTLHDNNSSLHFKNKTLTELNPNQNLKMLPFFLFYPNSLSLFNDDSDKKKIKFPLYKIFNNLILQNNYHNNDTFLKTDVESDFSSLNSPSTNNKFNNVNLTYKTFDIFSPNRVILPNERGLSQFSEHSPFVLNYNYSDNINTINNYSSSIDSNLIDLNNNYFYNLSRLN